jgi:hypothetical protein
MRPDKLQGLSIRASFDPGLGCNPSDLSVIGPDDAVLRGKLLRGPVHGIEKILHRAGAVLGM